MLTRYLVVQADNIMQISVHVVSYYVKLSKGGHIAGQNEIMNLDNLKKNF